MVSRKKTRKKTRKKAIPHPKDFLIPLKNLYVSMKIGGKLIIMPLMEVIAEFGKTIGKDIIGDILINSKLLIYDSVWGTNKLRKRIRKHTAQGNTKKKKKKKKSTRKKRR
jgi:hypothetical protein